MVVCSVCGERFTRYILNVVASRLEVDPAIARSAWRVAGCGAAGLHHLPAGESPMPALADIVTVIFDRVAADDAGLFD